MPPCCHREGWTWLAIFRLSEEQASLIGHDWGASAVYSALAQGPERVRCAAILDIPHPVQRIIARGEASVSHVATDRDRNILVAGIAHENLDFGQGDLREGSFFAKFDSKGRLIWARTFERMMPTGLATDRNGNIYLSGNTPTPNEYLDFGLGPIVTPYDSDSLGFLVKFSPAGTVEAATSTSPGTSASAARFAG